MGSGTTFAKIAIYGFVLVFCAIGIGLLYGAVVKFEDGETTNAIMMLIAALLFGGFGFGVYALVAVGFRGQAREATLKTTHPDEPWMWREDWASGRVRGTGKAGVWFFWGFAILWSLGSAPLLFFLPSEIFEEGNYAALLGFLFPIVGIGLLVVAVRKTIQRRKYGDPLFLMENVPGVLGGEVSGTVVIQRGLPTAETLTARLSCIHRERRRTGKSTSTVENVLWQTEPLVARLAPAVDGQGAAVRFAVPYDASPTGEIDDDNSILWKLDANASVPGVDFTADFEIPVFKTRASSPQKTEEQLRSEEVAAEAPAIKPEGETGFVVNPSTGGGTEFVLKPRGALPGTIGGIVGAIIFIGIGVLLAYAGAPLIFPLVFCFFALVIAFGVVFGAFGTSSVIVEEGNATIRNSLFGMSKSRRIPCSSITKIGVKGDGQSGKRAYYSVVLNLSDGKSASPLQFLRDRQQADWLAEELRRAMEPWRGAKRSD